MKRISVFLIFLLAPFIPIFAIAYNFSDYDLEISSGLNQMDTHRFNKIDTELKINLSDIFNDIESLSNSIDEIDTIVSSKVENLSEKEQQISSLTNKSASHKRLSEEIYDQIIEKILGASVYEYTSDRVEIMIYELAELDYRGYIAKVKLHDPKVFKLALAKSENGAEKTSSIAKRNKAIFAINAGGFSKKKVDDKTVYGLIGNNVVNGKLVSDFYNGDELFFAGINSKGEVIGSVPKTKEELMQMDPYQGTSFVPILIKDGKKLDIPSEWIVTKHPRTIIGKYANDDLIMLVIDGRRDDWSAGVSLELLQDKLIELGVRDAYNLDGGGSATMYFNGEILNKPSDGFERSVVNSFVIIP